MLGLVVHTNILERICYCHRRSIPSTVVYRINTNHIQLDIFIMERIIISAFHALAYHAVSRMKEFQVGTYKEWDEVLGILYSLKDDVVGDTNVAGKSLPTQHSMEQISDVVSSFHYLVKEAVPKYLRTLPLPRHAHEILKLSAAELYDLLPLLLVLLSPLIALQFIKRIGESHNLSKNNSGLFQFSSIFYYGEGLVSALPYFLGLLPSLIALSSIYLLLGPMSH